ncbi:MAG TPA: hypothetical protein P5076_19070, partial [Myxococcota bacterium]|nr:hypothetical protein [Myxococcota bacterium]
LPGGARTISIQPEYGTRFSLLLGLGLRFVILERAFLHGGYLWEAPLFGLSSSAWLAGAGVLF